jgi:hypothetical protein
MWKNWINDEKRQAKTLQQNIDVLSIYDKALECFSCKLNTFYQLSRFFYL